MIYCTNLTRRTIYFPSLNTLMDNPTYHYSFPDKANTQLFNLKNDPMEINNLIHDNSLNDKVDTLRLKMTQLKEETNDNSKFWEQ